MLSHPFSHTPIYEDSNILILGSFPSIISRERGFYYANTRNRFWNLVREIFRLDSKIVESKNIKNLPCASQNSRKSKALKKNLNDSKNTDIYLNNFNNPLSTTQAKLSFLKANHIVLWDIAKECEIKNSDDSTLKALSFNDIISLLKSSNISTIVLNGTKATNLFIKYLKSYKIESKLMNTDSSPYQNIYFTNFKSNAKLDSTLTFMESKIKAKIEAESIILESKLAKSSHFKNLNSKTSYSKYSHCKVFSPSPKLTKILKREIKILSFPSTSPANATFSFERLLKCWRILKDI